jgi:hypothetical protein
VLQGDGEYVVLHLLSNVKVTNELGFCFGTLDDLWQRRAK